MSSENDEQETVMSPLVTAQDRKRMILERRRKERDVSSNAANTSQTSDTSAFGIKRRKSDTRSKRLFKSAEDANRSTLFGAVMQRTNALATPTKTLHSHDDSSATTPNRVSWNDATTTPSSSSRSKSFLSADSPGGFALLKVLNSVASPFRHKDEEAEEQVTSPIKRLEEWQEAPLRGVVDWSIKRKLLIECHPGSCLPEGADWEEATRYWQHPAMHPLPQLDEGADTSQSVSASIHPSSTVQGRDALLHRLVRHDPRLWKQRRNREWQEAFRSLYFMWLEKVESLQREERASPKKVTETYFYIMAPGQVALFRIGMEQERLVPMVVMSSSTHQLRSKLRSMGAKLLYYNEGREKFNEVMRSNKPSTEDEANELEELRRAQAHGETAGADVSIATKKASAKSPRSVLPLCLVGEDDCAAFFEFYLNTFGRCDTWRTGNGDVPLLLSRKIGPFPHASLQSLVVSNRRAGSQANDPHAAIELRGPILPCALQELVGTAALRMMQDTTAKNQPSDDEVGSHYFVVQVQTHDGKDRPTSVNATGTGGSHWLNDGANMFGKLEAAPSECEHGQVLAMIVWDVVRPNMMAYKTEPAVGLVS